MDATEKLYYSLGQLAYVIAKADGEIQKQEQKKLQDLIIEATKDHNLDFNYSEIIFWVLEKEKEDSNTVYSLAMKTFKSLNHFFTPDLKIKFIEVLQKIADAYPPYSIEEVEYMAKIRKDIGEL